MVSKKLILAPVILLLAFLAANAQTACTADANDLMQYNGRFVFPDGSLLVLRQADGQLTARPIFWTSLQVLERKSGDAFGIEGRDDRKVEFVRDAGGCISAVTLAGFGADGTFPKAGEEKMPVEYLLDGQPEKAARMMIAAYPKEPKRSVELAEALLNKRPSQSAAAVSYLAELAKQFPGEAKVFTVLGWGDINIDDRKSALANFQKAYRLDANNEEAKAGLRRLDALQPTPAERSAGWQLPFSLDKVFAPPTASEIKAAEADWARRDLAPKDVREVATGELDLGQTKAKVRIVSHTVHGFKHYGAIIIPEGAKTSKRPVLLDLKGVSPDFFPLNLERLMSPKILGESQGEFIYVVPSFRGERLQFNGKEYRSEGDPTDSWDGATDDALAFLNAALQMTPQADNDRIAAFGKSRGGALAMLAGIRDTRIKRVVSWSGPADFFKLMGEGGWWQKEVVSEALLHRAKPEDDGGQFVATFLAAAIAGKKTLADARRLMIQSSALYFAHRLPLTEAYYGVEDGMVHVRNGRELEKVTKNAGKVTVFYHQAAGHDLNTKLAVPETRKFLLELKSEPGTK
jgi:tetratricopeptide (TPR) repeat protein